MLIEERNSISEKTIKETNSYLTKEQLELLYKNGFSWCNYGGTDSDNYYSKNENSIDYRIIVFPNKIKLTQIIPSYIGNIVNKREYLDLEIFLKDYNKLELSNKLNTFVFKLNSLIFGLFFIFFLTIVIPFVKTEEDKMKIIKSKSMDIFKFNYYYLQDSLPFVWGFNLFILGGLIVYLLII